ncbi:MAG: nucleoside-diphosphate sugar epimerase/dehydratase, partial [Xanthomonadales bacterium]|nr:nucleoside-diphosphate sugar epimerase/dehydratase [Xanthomonadales bacterium]
LRMEGDYYPIGFLDDDVQLRGRKLRGLPVFGGIDELSRIVREQSVDLVVIAIPSASNQEMQRIVGICESCEVEFRTVPRLQDVVSGRFGFNQLKTVAIEDLLGRDPVKLDWDAIRTGCGGRAVLITGGGGSIGSELCRQIAQLAPNRLGIVENSEFNLYNIDRELRQRFPELVIEPVLGDVCDPVLMDRVMGGFKPDLIFHAAAHKHVPLLQTQLREAVRNNVLGTVIVARAAMRHRVERFVFISTDKAVNPISVMGATKRAAEIYCQTLAADSATRFLTVRFGNVLDSAGSVVPLFREQIEQGGPVTVTHPEVTRFFMTIPEACQLILETAAVGSSGEIYVLDMGEPVRITYLAEQMIRLAGKVPGEDIEIVYSGLRSGEKLFEELFHELEPYVSTDYEQILRARHREPDHNQVVGAVAALEEAVKGFDESALESGLRRLVPDYRKDSDNLIDLKEIKGGSA